MHDAPMRSDPSRQILLPFRVPGKPPPVVGLPEGDRNRTLQALAQLLIQVVVNPRRVEKDHDAN